MLNEFESILNSLLSIVVARFGRILPGLALFQFFLEPFQLFLLFPPRWLFLRWWGVKPNLELRRVFNLWTLATLRINGRFCC